MQRFVLPDGPTEENQRDQAQSTEGHRTPETRQRGFTVEDDDGDDESEDENETEVEVVRRPLFGASMASSSARDKATFFEPCPAEDREAELYIRHFEPIMNNVALGYVNLTKLINEIGAQTGRPVDLRNFRRDRRDTIEHISAQLGCPVTHAGDVSTCKNFLSRLNDLWNDGANATRIRDVDPISQFKRQGHYEKNQQTPPPALILTYQGKHVDSCPFAIRVEIASSLVMWGVPQFMDQAESCMAALLGGDLSVAHQVVRNYNRANGTTYSFTVISRPADTASSAEPMKARPHIAMPSRRMVYPLRRTVSRRNPSKRSHPPSTTSNDGALALVIVQTLQSVISSLDRATSYANEARAADRNVLLASMSALNLTAANAKEAQDADRSVLLASMSALDAERRENKERQAATEADKARMQAALDAANERAHGAELDVLRGEVERMKISSSASSSSASPTAASRRQDMSALVLQLLTVFYVKLPGTLGKPHGQKRTSTIDLSKPRWLYLAEVVPFQSEIAIAIKVGITIDLRRRIYENIMEDRYVLVAWHVETDGDELEICEKMVINLSKAYRSSDAYGRESFKRSAADMSIDVEAVLQTRKVRHGKRVYVRESFIQ